MICPSIFHPTCSARNEQSLLGVDDVLLEYSAKSRLFSITLKLLIIAPAHRRGFVTLARRLKCIGWLDHDKWILRDALGVSSGLPQPPSDLTSKGHFSAAGRHKLRLDRSHAIGVPVGWCSSALFPKHPCSLHCLIRFFP